MFKPVPTKVDFVAMEQRDAPVVETSSDMMQSVPRAATQASRAALVVPRRPDHRQQPDGRAPRLGPHATRTSTSATRRCTATSSATRTASTARACGSRSRSRRSWASSPSATSRRTASTRFVERCKERVRKFSGDPDRAVDPPRATGWTGTTPTTRCPTRTTTPSGPSSRSATSAGWIYKGHDVDALVPALRHRPLAAWRSHRGLPRGHAHQSVFLQLPAARTATDEYAAGLDDDALDAGRERRRRGAPRADLRAGRGRATTCYYVAPGALAQLIAGEHEVLERGARARELVGLALRRPVRRAAARRQGVDAPRHRRGTRSATTEGTGIVHIAPGCGEEDFDAGARSYGLPVIAPIDEDGVYRRRASAGSTGSVAGDVARRRSSTTCSEQGHALPRARTTRTATRICWRCGTRAGLPAGRRVVHRAWTSCATRSWT